MPNNFQEMQWMYVYIYMYIRMCVCVAATTLILLHVSCCTLLSVRQRHTVHNYVHYIVYISSTVSTYVCMYTCMASMDIHTFRMYMSCTRSVNKLSVGSWFKIVCHWTHCHSVTHSHPLAHSLWSCLTLLANAHKIMWYCPVLPSYMHVHHVVQL